MNERKMKIVLITFCKLQQAWTFFYENDTGSRQCNVNCIKRCRNNTSFVTKMSFLTIKSNNYSSQRLNTRSISNIQGISYTKVIISNQDEYISSKNTTFVCVCRGGNFSCADFPWWRFSASGFFRMRWFVWAHMSVGELLRVFLVWRILVHGLFRSPKN